ncbi:hypothetical protein HMPREF1639_00855 [Peptostreptococcus sp. MV1]|uniref:DUF2922 domain-containing protein n=1 Tax=Peptostreptococcus sp. MV1 TaxID=1219626 RepID=UPI00050F3317|nr:DUF2922 domain-containing protein [Peptostreptococcus sp. MV1]KGF15401.1 hypothetical protein HMPREF1639_00855 [Peptostreptococcus sp. MV1]
MEKRKMIAMRFKKEDGKTFNLSVRNPGSGVNEESIKKVMDMVVEKNVFRIKGQGLVKTIDAKIVETSTETYDLVL